MAAVVLALTGLTAGGGGPGAGLAHGEVEVSFAGQWEGTLRRRGAAEGHHIDWDNDRGFLTVNGEALFKHNHLTAAGGCGSGTAFQGGAPGTPTRCPPAGYASACPAPNPRCWSCAPPPGASPSPPDASTATN
jgi:hypothetical protein